MQNVFTLEINKYNIKINDFEGPLDLLCHLIDINKMDIYDVNLSRLTDQYIDYINQMEEMNLEVTSEFLIMASTLLLIKSKGLLPNTENSNEEELTEEELIKRIIEYKKYKEITDTVIGLELSIDMIAYGNTIYFFNNSGEKLFNMERAYKAVCKEKIEEIKDIREEMQYYLFERRD